MLEEPNIPQNIPFTDYDYDEHFNLIKRIPFTSILQDFQTIITLENVKEIQTRIVKDYPEFEQYISLPCSSITGDYHPIFFLGAPLGSGGQPGRWEWSCAHNDRIWRSRYNNAFFSGKGGLEYIDPKLIEIFDKPKPPFNETLIEIQKSGQGFIFNQFLLHSEKRYLLLSEEEKSLVKTTNGFKHIGDTSIGEGVSSLYEVQPDSIFNLEHGNLIETYYRGSTHRYPFAIAASNYRPNNLIFKAFQKCQKEKGNWQKWYDAIEKIDQYLSNIITERVWKELGIFISKELSQALLHHFALSPLSEVLDVSCDVNVAKWFALAEWQPASENKSHFWQEYQQKKFQTPPYSTYQKMVEDSSAIYYYSDTGYQTRPRFL